jgi:hypothetical protein
VITPPVPIRFAATTEQEPAMPYVIAHTRIFVALTLAEAAAIGRLTPGPDPDAIGAVAKIRTAFEHAALSPEALRMAKARLPPARAPKRAPAPVDDYVPFRDEADGLYT